MIPPEALGGDDGGAPSPFAPSGAAQRRKKKEKSIFDMPESTEEMLKDGEQTVDYFRDLAVRLRKEGADAQCSAVLLGSVEASFPRLRAALVEAGVDCARVEGLWVVPPFVLKGLDGPKVRWAEARGRLGPFFKNDMWRKIDAEVRDGRAVNFAPMGLQPDNLVVAKHRATWLSIAMAAVKQLSWARAKQAARSAYAGATLRNARALGVRLWPYKWLWLLAWLVGDLLVLLSYVLTSDLVPFRWTDILTLSLGNAFVLGYALRGRTEADAALGDAESFKTAGSVALKRGKLDVAIEQYAHGEESAAKLHTHEYLNSAFLARGPPLRIACLNNAALVRLKQQEWQMAADLCDRALALSPAAAAAVGSSSGGGPGGGPGGGSGGGGDARTAAADDEAGLAAAKSHFRRGIALAKLDRVPRALAALHAARRLKPSDSEIVGMIRVLEWGQAQARRRDAAQQEEVDDTDDAEADAGLEPAKVEKAYRALLDPEAPTETQSLGTFGAPPPIDFLAEPVKKVADKPVAAAAKAADEKLADKPVAAAAKAADGKLADKPPATAAAKAVHGKVADKPPATAAAGASARPSPATVAAPSQVASSQPPPPAAAAARSPPKQHPAPTLTPSGTHKVLKFTWARTQLEHCLVGIECATAPPDKEKDWSRGEGDSVVTTAVASLRGEAYVETDARRGKVARAFDLSFALEWRARIRGKTYTGSINFSDVSTENDLDEVEIEARFSEAKDHPDQETLIALIGPLRPEAAVSAGRLTGRLWQGLAAFRDAFAAVSADEGLPQPGEVRHRNPELGTTADAQIRVRGVTDGE